MSKLRIFILLLIVGSGQSWAQETSSKADNFFYAYAYEDAIREYQNEMQESSLTNSQRLNLADSYFQTGKYSEASKIYLDINKNDTIITSHRYNKMLQSLAKTKQNDTLSSLLASNSNILSNELVENANFNNELLSANDENASKFDIFNINGNSPQADFSPAFFNDKLLFSSSRGHKGKEIYGPSGEAYLDIYLARVGSDGDIVNPSLFDVIPPSSYHKSTPHYAKSLNRIFYVLSNAEDDELLYNEKDKNSLAIGIARSSATPEKSFHYLLKDLNTSFYYPFYQEETEKLYFAANFDDGYGGTDIYFVYTNNAQIMSEPINAGPKVNSPGNEIAPFIFDNSLYFSSDVFYGLGGMDIYKTNIQPDDTYSIPINLGGGINSEYDEFGFIIREQAPDGYLGYFASNRPGGKGKDDIYGFKVNSLPGLKTLVLKGVVAKPRTGVGVSDVAVRILNGQGTLIKETVSDVGGNYQLEIPWRDEVTVEAFKENHSRYLKAYTKEELERVNGTPLKIDMLVLADVVAEKEGKLVLKLNDFLFEESKSEITPEIAIELDKVVDALQKFPEMKVRIESHTDSRGNRNTNLKLSQNQAQAIKTYVLDKGVPSSSIVKTLGFGESQLTNNCKDGVYCLEFLHNQNSRTLFIVDNFEELN